MNQQKNSSVGIFSFVLILIGIFAIFGTDHILDGIGVLSLGLLIILIKMTWGVSGWAYDTMQRW